MAGIGFRLHKLVQGDTYTRSAAAYLSSALISAGPWLSSVVALVLLGGASVAFLGTTERNLLIVTITYAFGGSLILMGGPQLMITRYLADRFYLEDRGSVAPALNGALLAAVPLAVLALPFLLLAPFDWRYRLLSVTLFVALSLNWLVGVFLSAARYFANIAVIYILGYALSLGGAVWLGRAQGLLGGLAGYAFGQVVCTLLLAAHIAREFPNARAVSLSFVGYFGRFGDLGVLGLLSMLGIWADNVIYWFAPGSVVIADFYRSNPTYDAMKLVAVLTTVPASALFLVHVETRFFRHYRAFFRHIEHGGTLADIVASREGMIAAARAGIANVAKMQTIVVGAALLFAPDLLRLLDLPTERIGLFRTLVIAANCQFIMALAVILILYLDERRQALIVTALFVGGNVVGTLGSLLLGPGFFGVGFLGAAALAAIVALALLFARLRQLEYLTFMSQPLAMAKVDV